MPIVRRLARLNRTVQMALVAAAAFAIGSATVASASIAGIPVGSLFYLPMINGIATTPCSTTATNTTTCNAIVDSSGNLHVTGASTVTGSVGVNNFPGDQQVHGSVSVSNLSADQMIHGMVGINNFPDIQKVSGTVNIGNLPATQAVNGTVNVGNLPTDQQIHGSVTITNLPAATGSSGVTLIPLANHNVAGGSSTEWRGVDVSSCRKVAIGMGQFDSTGNNPTINVFIEVPGGFPPEADVQQRGGAGATWAYVLQPGSNEGFFGTSLTIDASNHSGAAADIGGNVYCSH